MRLKMRDAHPPWYPRFISPCLSAAKCVDSNLLRMRSDKIALHWWHSRQLPGSIHTAVQEDIERDTGRRSGTELPSALHHLEFAFYRWWFRAEECLTAWAYTRSSCR